MGRWTDVFYSDGVPRPWVLTVFLLLQMFQMSLIYMVIQGQSYALATRDSAVVNIMYGIGKNGESIAVLEYRLGRLDSVVERVDRLASILSSRKARIASLESRVEELNDIVTGR